MRRRLSFRVAVILTIVGVGLATTSQIAFAGISSTNNWSDASLTGYCGDAAGDYVAAAQAYLQSDANHYLPLSDKIDGEFGNETYNAVYDYQLANDGHLQVDGCVGPQTWEYMNSNLHAPTYGTCSGSVALGLFGKGSGSTEAVFIQRSDNLHWFVDVAAPGLNPGGSISASQFYLMRDSFDGHSSVC